MKKTQLTILSIGVATLMATAIIPSFTSLAVEPKPAAEAAKVYTTEETKEFIALTRATLEALAAGKQPEVVAKLTDLETAWDDKEAKLKPRDEATWTLLDKTLDKAISALRSSRTDLQKGKTALEDLLRMLGQATKE